MQYSVAVLPFFPCLLQKQENIFFPCIKFSRLSSPKIPRHRNHSTYFLYLLSRCRLLSLELSEHQVHLPFQGQNRQLLLLHGLSPDSPNTGTNDQKNTHQTSPPGSYYLYLSPRRRLLSSSCPGKQRSIFYGSWQVLEHFPKSHLLPRQSLQKSNRLLSSRKTSSSCSCTSSPSSQGPMDT